MTIEERIIPARAGFTFRPGSRSCRDGDHPRSRGVYQPAWASPIPPRGSSPLARGLRHLGEGVGPGRGIIPARAGFTRSPRAASSARTDHPRSRGVYPISTSTPTSPSGSSPLARGLRRRHVFGQVVRRIIPARAGFTLSPMSRIICGKDHPRSRGVYRDGWSTRGRRRGSSPLARGLRVRSTSTTGASRIIPARAGFTVHGRGRRPRRRDHPRSRGVYPSHSPEDMGPTGSSPLARGLLTRARPVLPGRRIIPARAGFTPS